MFMAGEKVSFVVFRGILSLPTGILEVSRKKNRLGPHSKRLIVQQSQQLLFY
jgi:hypothetical protein